VIVFVLRHADKKRPPPANVDDLTPAGLERAAVLARLLADSGVSVAFCSEAVRARRTLEPLQAKLGGALTLNPVAIDPDHPEQHVGAIVDAVKLLASDKVAVVVTHSTTVSPIIEGLGGETVGEIDDRVFDRLFVLSREPAAAPTVLRLRYGRPTPP
jgi:phosphohistidine phosphatase SixA